MSGQKKRNARKLLVLWEKHDTLERKIIHLERKFTDKELAKLNFGLTD